LLIIIEFPELEATGFPWKKKVNNTKTTKKSKRESELSRTQKIRTKLSLTADKVKASSKDENIDGIKNVKLLKIKNRIESGYYELKEVKIELIDSLFNKIFETKND